MKLEKKKRIIIADDDEDDRMLVSDAFADSKADIRIEFAVDGSQLMESLAKGSGDVQTLFILLDLNMPKKDGREVLKEIKENPELKKIPVIVFTTAKNVAEIRKCYELGANTYIIKPDNYADLLKAVKSLSTYWIETATAPT